MKRERPIVISAICVYFFAMNLSPTAPLMHKAFELLKEFSQGGFEQFYSAYKASVNPQITERFILVAAVYTALAGMWFMKGWSVFLLAGAVSWNLWGLFTGGFLSLFSFYLPLIGLLSAFYFFFKKPAVRVYQPEVHYYSGSPTPPAEADTKEGEVKGEKSALEDLIY